jgi:ubiquinone/menaquinone biosynthesis C-methylase UbiE
VTDEPTRILTFPSNGPSHGPVGVIAVPRSSGHHEDHARRQESAGHLADVVLDFIQRTYRAEPNMSLLQTLRKASSIPHGSRILDFGCGAGSTMEWLVDAGFRVDGIDANDRLLALAGQKPMLEGCEFFATRGPNCGAAPDHAYDLVYSRLAFQQTCSRTLRGELLADLARVLRPGGVLIVEMTFSSQHRAGTIPAPHVAWSGEHFETGAAEPPTVCVTPDELHVVYGDLAQHFFDVRLQFVDGPHRGDGTRHTQLVLSGATKRSFGTRG